MPACQHLSSFHCETSLSAKPPEAFRIWFLAFGLGLKNLPSGPSNPELVQWSSGRSPRKRGKTERSAPRHTIPLTQKKSAIIIIVKLFLRTSSIMSFFLDDIEVAKSLQTCTRQLSENHLRNDLSSGGKAKNTQTQVCVCVYVAKHGLLRLATNPLNPLSPLQRSMRSLDGAQTPPTWGKNKEPSKQQGKQGSWEGRFSR